LEDVSVVFGRPALVLRGVSHLQRVLQNSHELFNLAVVENTGWDAPLRRKSFEKVHPLSPFSVLWSFHRPHVLGERDWELVFGHEVERTLGKSVIDLAQDIILLLDEKVCGQMGQLTLLKSNDFWSRPWKELVRSIELISV
jgi:hypothetical protein